MPISLTERQSAMLKLAQSAVFGQIRQQAISADERKDCLELVALGLMKDVVGTTFMLTDAGRRH